MRIANPHLSPEQKDAIRALRRLLDAAYAGSPTDARWEELRPATADVLRLLLGRKPTDAELVCAGGRGNLDLIDEHQ